MPDVNKRGRGATGDSGVRRRTYLRGVGAGVAGLATAFGAGTGSAEARPTSDIEVDVVATDLVVPWGAAFDDGTLYVTERPGYLTRITDDGFERVADFTDDTVSYHDAGTPGTTTSGLCGLTFHPEAEGVAILYQSYRRDDGEIANRLLQYDLEEGTSDVFFDGIGGSYWQDGGRLLVTDGALYVTTGQGVFWDRQNGAVQDPSTLVGKTLRLTLDGESHPDNPFGNAVYTLGHRNPEGIALRRNGQLFATEHGPDMNDEINLLRAGNNYGWPVVTGESDGDEFTDPIVSYTPTIAPAGATFYYGDDPGWKDSFFFATLNGQTLYRLRFTGGPRPKLIRQERLLYRQYGRLRAVFTGPDGALYVTTSNRDQSGSADGSGDFDYILRVRRSHPGSGSAGEQGNDAEREEGLPKGPVRGDRAPRRAVRARVPHATHHF